MRLKDPHHPSRTADKFVIRLPLGLRERIAYVAAAHHRSMNSEIIVRLQYGFAQENALKGELDVGFDSPELSAAERELLQRFRQLAKRRQNALVSLIGLGTAKI